jgi:hypothetical protein
MITDKDILFHTPKQVPYDWAETGYFNFYIPEHNILGLVYVVHRAGVGATVSDIEILDRKSLSCMDTVYTDLRNHNSIPARAENFELSSGLKYSAQSIRDYSISYDAGNIGLDIQCTSLMEPYDIHDPSMDPMAEADSTAAVANSGFGAAYTAHFDMTVRITGTLRIASRTHKIDCISTMDHSWGPRAENKFPPISWTNAHFGESLCLHAIFASDALRREGEQCIFKHGYVLIDGKVHGAKAGKLTVRRDGYFIVGADLSVTDIGGREYRARGEMLTHHPWMPYGNNYSPMGMMRWVSEDGQSGHGTYMEGIALNRLRGDHAK